MRKIEIVIEGESWVVVLIKMKGFFMNWCKLEVMNYQESPLRFKIGYAPATSLYIDDQKLVF